MHRFRILCIAIGVAVTCSAQMPYEFFTFRSLVPVQVQTAAGVLPDPSAMPTTALNSADGARLAYLTIDEKTARGGDLTLVEPFAPPVGVYKRYGVLSEIELSGDTWLIKPPPDLHCIPYRPARPPASHTVYRSGIVMGTTTTDDAEILIPSTDPKMAIVSFRVFDASNGSSSRLPSALYRCDGDVYVAKLRRAGSYRIEYEVASPPNSGMPQSPDLFADARPRPSVKTDPESRKRRDRILHILENTSVYPQDNRTLRDVIAYYQSFISESLDLTPNTRWKNDELLERILDERKGLCRHRAFLFMLTAEAWGYEARIVYNEAHAFIEIESDGEWVPIELGGQADSLRVVSPDFRRSERRRWSDVVAPSLDHAVSAATRRDAAENSPTSPQLALHPTTILRFVPYGNPTTRVFRNAVLQYRGRLYRQNGEPYTGKMAKLVMENGSAVLTKTAPIRSMGDVEISMDIPITWPLGRTHTTWYAVVGE